MSPEIFVWIVAAVIVGIMLGDLLIMLALIVVGLPLALVGDFIISFCKWWTKEEKF